MIILAARFLSNLKERNISYKELLLQMLYLGALLAVPIFLILIQPDFGTAMVFCVSIFAMFFIWGLDYRIIKYGVVALAGLAPIVYMFFLKPGQKERIRVFFNPSIDPTGSGYNVLQAILAVGSGQFWGMGLFEGTQTQMGFLPAKTTDFIFSVIAEEMGFVVAAILIVLLIILVLQCFVVARNADTYTGTLIATGIGVMFLFHILVNIGMNMGIVPVTGIPLPFVSYGGSSLLTNLIAIGIVLSISFRKKRLNF
jgi:rod shape determining protein RodA